MTKLGQRWGSGVTRVRVVGQGKKSPNGSTGLLSVPASMSRMLPEGALFRAEWHEDGILYRFMGVSTEEHNIADAERPAWTENGA